MKGAFLYLSNERVEILNLLKKNYLMTGHWHSDRVVIMRMFASLACVNILQGSGFRFAGLKDRRKRKEKQLS